MRVQPAPRIMAVALLCAAALIVLVISEGDARARGQEALLPMEAVDPRSLLHGHYVQLNLVQRLDSDIPCPQAEPTADWLAFVRTGDGVLRFVGAAVSREAAQRIAPVLVKGTFSCFEAAAPAEGEPSPRSLVQLDIGFDRFHINQADALRIEQILRGQRPEEETRAYALVSVARDGRARLKGLVVDGERFELEWL